MEVIVFIIIVGLFVTIFFLFSDKSEDITNNILTENAKDDAAIALSLINANLETARHSLREVQEKLNSDGINGNELDKEIDQYRQVLEETISTAEKNKTIFSPEGYVILKIPDFDEVRRQLHTELLGAIQAATTFSTHLVLSEKNEHENLTPSMFLAIAKIKLQSIKWYANSLSIAKYIEKPDFSDSAQESVIQFLIKIAANDNKISDLEIDLLNGLSAKTLTKEEYINQSKVAINSDEATNVQYANELVELLSYIKNVSEDCAKLLYMDIKELAFTLIAIDEDRDEDEIQILTEEMNAIETALYPKSTTAISNNSGPQKSRGISDSNEPINKSLNELTDELESLIGLAGVKQNVLSLLNMIRVNEMRQEFGMKATPVTHHLVFTGNPGTGKTTVARILAGIYRELGVLSKGHLIEVSRHSLVGGYVGQTAIKTQKVIEESIGGILFIDEAYSLAKTDSGMDYGSEAIETLLKAMEDNRRDFVVIAAGYPYEMSNFINSNPGLKSRFTKYIKFDDYNIDELFKIFISYVTQNGYSLSNSAEEEITNIIRSIYNQRGKNFGNARAMRTLFESIVQNHSNRVIAFDKPTEEQLQSLTLDDMPSIQSATAFA
jgi:AAA+ superfamily predicted ATPase